MALDRWLEQSSGVAPLAGLALLNHSSSSTVDLNNPYRLQNGTAASLRRPRWPMTLAAR